MEKLIIILGLLTFTTCTLFGQDSKSLVGTWSKGNAEIQLHNNKQAEFRMTNGKLLKGTWSTTPNYGRSEKLVISSNDKKFAFEYALDGNTELVIGITNSNKKYRFTKDDIALNTIAQKKYAQNNPTYKNAKSNTANSSLNVSDALTTALIVGGGLWLLDTMLGGNTSSSNNNQYSSDHNTNRMMKNWAEQETYDQHH